MPSFVAPKPPKTPTRALTQGNLDQIGQRLLQLRPDANLKKHGRAALALKAVGASDNLTAQLLCAQGANDGEITACASRPVGVKLASNKESRQPPSASGFRDDVQLGIPGWLSKAMKENGLKPPKYMPAGPLPSSAKIAEETQLALKQIGELVTEKPPKPKKPKKEKVAKPKKEKVAKPKKEKVAKPKKEKVAKPKAEPKPKKPKKEKAAAAAIDENLADSLLGDDLDKA